jgi:iron complex outermembrane receptor protein
MLLAPLPAAAQVAAEAAASDDAAIIVTAQRRDQALIDVPITIDVLAGGDLAAMRVDRPQDMQALVPGLVITQFGVVAKFALRGVGSDIAGLGTSDSVASHVDGVYLGFAGPAVSRMFDLERVEVLKGPQGTLYGRNTTGGVINFISRSPGDSFAANAEFSLGSFGAVRWSGGVDIPIAEGASVRLATAGGRSDGYIDNVLDDQKFGAEDWRAFRGRGKFQLAEGLEADLFAMYVRDTGTTQLPYILFRPPAAAAVPCFYCTRVNAPSSNDLTDKIFGLTVTADVSNNIKIRNITGYLDHSGSEQRDVSLLNANFNGNQFFLIQNFEQFSNEFQVLGTYDRWNWVTGIFYSKDEGDELREFFSIPSPGANRVLFINRRGTDSNRTWAGFFDATYEATDKLSITGGLRYTKEDRSFSADDAAIGQSVEGDRSFSDPSGRLVLAYRLNDNQNFFASISRGFKSGGVGFLQRLDGTIAEDPFESERLWAYEIGSKGRYFDGVLDLNVSAFYYDYDNLQVTLPSPETDLEAVPPRIAFETGNAASARIIGTDVSAVVRPTKGLQIGMNVEWLPTAKYLEYIADPRIDPNTGLPRGDFSGNRLVRAPEFMSSTFIEYAHEVGERGQIFGRLEHNYRSSMFFNPQNQRDETAQSKFQPAYHLVNATIRYESGAGYTLFGRVRNLTNERFFTQLNPSAFANVPREFEVGFAVNF